MRSLRSSRSFRSARIMAVATGVAVATMMMGAAPVSAGVSITPFTVTPDPVAPGGTLTISGVGCGDGTVSLELFAGDFGGTMVEPSDPTVDNVDTAANLAGAWSGTMTAPATAKTGDKLTVWARCFSEASTFTYLNVAVTVVDPADTTTTTTTLAGSTTTAPATSTTVAAAPATAVPATPTFTG